MLANSSSYWLTQPPRAAVTNSCQWECMSGYEKNPTARVYEPALLAQPVQPGHSPVAGGPCNALPGVRGAVRGGAGGYS